MSDFYRDRTDGALARRQDLLRKRRDELVLMPHAVRRVVVARAARAAASAATIACGVFLLATALSPVLAHGVAHYMPGINPAAIATSVAAAWVIGLVAYSVSRGRSEHRFAVAMSSYVLPGDDLDEDIERLSHERPDKVAREMAHRLEIASAALPVAAAAFVLPATLMYLAGMIATRGWPSTAMYESELTWASHKLLYVAIAGIFAAIAMTQRPLRRPGVTRIAGLIALVAFGLGVRAFFAAEITSLWVFTATGTIASAIAFVNARLAKERVAIEAIDPAAGAELFTLRGALHSLRSAFARLHVTPAMLAGMAAFGVLVLAGGDSVIPTATRASTPMQAVTVIVPSGPVSLAPVLPPSRPTGGSSYKMSHDTLGNITVTATFLDGKPLVIRDGLLGVGVVPRGWRARIAISEVSGRLRDDDAIGADLVVTPFADDADVQPRPLNANAIAQTFELSACDGRDHSIALRLSPGEGWAGTHTIDFRIDPTLSIARCDQ